jgi:hypothetical protein
MTQYPGDPDKFEKDFVGYPMNDLIGVQSD